MSLKPKPAISYLNSCIKNLAALGEAGQSAGLDRVDEMLLSDVAFYVRQRFDNRITEAEICALLSEAWQKLRKRLDNPGPAVEAPERYFREIVKRLVQDQIQRDRQDERYVISAEGISNLADNGISEEILLAFENRISLQPLSYRTMLEKFTDVYSGMAYSKGTIDLHRRICLGAFKIRLRSDAPEGMADLRFDPDVKQERSIENEAYSDCLQRLAQQDRDLIKLRFGLDRGLDGFQFSFEELQEIFGFHSLQQVRNRYHYILKKMKDCLSGKGYPLG